MPNYHRLYVPGGTYFLTVVTYNRRPIFHNPLARTLLREVWERVAKEHPFTTNALCLLPEHFHTAWTLPPNDSDYSIRISEIKRQFSFRYIREIEPVFEKSASRLKRGEVSVWQRRFWGRVIQDEEDFATCMDYIHFNPVKHGLVSRPEEWPFSTYHKYVRLGFSK